MKVRTVLYDANVLYPAPLRDLLVRLAMEGLLRARWTDAIHDEWTHNLRPGAPSESGSVEVVAIEQSPPRSHAFDLTTGRHVRTEAFLSVPGLQPPWAGHPEPRDPSGRGSGAVDPQ